MIRKRLAIGGLSLSAAALVALVASEGFTDKAIVPTAGDRPTIGFGSTFRENGTPVQLGDTISVPKALARSMPHIQKDELGLRECVTGELTQGEYDVLVDFAYQYGVRAACNSSVVHNINEGRYVEACESYGKYRYSQGRDCSKSENWGPGGCKGVWLRNLDRAERCKSTLAAFNSPEKQVNAR